ncbi:hypothetical protein L3X38_006545 [Prunus dulcis]|uniref:Uncharacterized protein n=1 Tax=Prunus dulcis TaxID=3755 RepID=A0AAD4ZT06_PRUDU|nr:hypothetical protein L3X38_006545 [Prunus dulcis]
MPWLAIPFSDLDTKKALNPFPFTKQRLEELQDEERARHENQTLTNLLTNHDRDNLLGPPHRLNRCLFASLVGKTIGLYFSAHWCPSSNR